MPVLLLISQSEPLIAEVMEALRDLPSSKGVLVPCSTVQQGIDVQASLTDPVIWLVEDSETCIENIPESQPQILLANSASPPHSEGIPCLERPIRPLELTTLISALEMQPVQSHAAFSPKHIETFVHDLNNRLTTISGYISLMPELMQGEDEMVSEMEKAMHEADRLIDGLAKQNESLKNQI